MAESAKKKILLLCNGNAIGGTERVVQLLASGLNARGLEIQTVFARGPQSDELLQWFREIGIEAQVSDGLRILNEPRTPESRRALTQLVRESHADAINYHTTYNYIPFKDVLAIRAGSRRRFVTTAHHPGPLEGMPRRTLFMMSLGARLSDKTLAYTDLQRSLLLRMGVPSSKIEVIQYGLCPPPFLPDKAEARTRLGLAPEHFVVGTLARLVQSKGIDALITAASRLSDPKNTLRLVIAGDGPERGALERQAREQMGDRTIFTERLPDTADFYSSCDLFVLPSHNEGFGLVYVEAAFHGVPSIGTLVGGIPEAIAGGETGLLVPLNDSAALVAAIKRLRDDAELRQKLGAAAKKRAHSEFTLEAMAANYARILQVN